MERSFYAERLHNYFENCQWDHIVEDKYENGIFSMWVNNKRIGVVNQRSVGRDIYEETYKGFQIVIMTWTTHANAVFDKNGKQFDRTDFNPDDVGHYGDLQVFTNSGAFAYKIGSKFDQIGSVGYSTQFSLLKGTGGSGSLDQVLKNAKKRLDLYAKLYEVKPDLEQLVNNRLYSSQAENPYNVKIGDAVFVQGHGRLRQGIVVDTTANKFIVGYLTPTNREDFHWKTLPLSHLYV